MSKPRRKGHGSGLISVRESIRWFRTAPGLVAAGIFLVAAAAGIVATYLQVLDRSLDITSVEPRAISVGPDSAVSVHLVQGRLFGQDTIVRVEDSEGRYIPVGRTVESDTRLSFSLNYEAFAPLFGLTVAVRARTFSVCVRNGESGKPECLDNALTVHLKDEATSVASSFPLGYLGTGTASLDAPGQLRVGQSRTISAQVALEVPLNEGGANIAAVLFEASSIIKSTPESGLPRLKNIRAKNIHMYEHMSAQLIGQAFEFEDRKPIERTVNGGATWSWSITPKGALFLGTQELTVVITADKRHIKTLNTAVEILAFEEFRPPDIPVAFPIEDEGGLSGGIIALIVVLGIIGVIVVAGGGFLAMRRRTA